MRFDWRWSLWMLTVTSPVLAITDDTYLTSCPNCYAPASLEAAEAQRNALLANPRVTRSEAQEIAAQAHITQRVATPAIQAVGSSSGTSGAYVPVVSSQPAASRTNAAPPEIEVTNMTYQRLFSDVKISIVDKDLGLTTDDKNTIVSLLDVIPEAHKKAIQTIHTRRQRDGLVNEQVKPGYWIIYASHIPPSANDLVTITDRISITSSVLFMLGRSVYQNQVNQNDWAASHPAGQRDPVALEWEFSSYYDNYVEGGLTQIKSAAEAEDEQTLRGYLYVAAQFTAPNGVASSYQVGPGEKVSLNYVPAYRDSQWLTIGNMHFALQGNQIVGMTTQDVYAQTKPGEPLKIIGYKVWDKPVTLSDALLQKFALKK